MDEKKKELKDLEKVISRPDFWQSQEPAAAAALNKNYEDKKSFLTDWLDLKNETKELLELSELAQEDDRALIFQIEKKLKQLQSQYQKMEFAVLFSQKYDSGDAIIAIHAGTGGVDAQDWAAMLLRMYLKFCSRRGFKTKIVDENPGAEAGLKTVTFSASGQFAYGWLKSENGVHRLVRISPFDAEKMRHTSFALVEVLPDLAEEAVEIKESDLKIETMRSSGHGGQSVNTTDSAVRLTHLPTGISVKCQNERSQSQNKKMALKILQARLLQYYGEAENKELKKIKGDYQKAAWGNQARSYVLQPYQLVKDHRSGFESSEVEKILNGEIEGFVESYLRESVKKN